MGMGRVVLMVTHAAQVVAVLAQMQTAVQVQNAAPLAHLVDLTTSAMGPPLEILNQP